MDRPRRSDCTAGQMDGEAGWWTTSGNIGLPPLARAMGVGRQQQIQFARRKIFLWAVPPRAGWSRWNLYDVIQTAQNVALRTATGAHKMASIDHLHQESLTLSQGPLRYAFCTVPCELSGEGPRLSWHHNSRPRPMKETPLQTSLNCSS